MRTTAHHPATVLHNRDCSGSPRSFELATVPPIASVLCFRLSTSSELQHSDSSNLSCLPASSVRTQRVRYQKLTLETWLSSPTLMTSSPGTHPGEDSPDTYLSVSTTASSPASDSQSARVPMSCSKAFDALYYCYSPFYQGKVYYQTGELDDCRGRLKRFHMCAMSRLRPEAESEVRFQYPFSSSTSVTYSMHVFYTSHFFFLKWWT